ncbi:acetyltransferase [Paenibacillus sp. 102]|uniref:acetyltransferase n=1 Tax=Paenibacillus sp. 102 TaxID=3120823 RepID=UPI0031BBC1B0
MLEEKVCPKCSDNQIEKGIINAGNGVVHMFPYNNPRGKSSPISSYFCSNCGYALGLYVEKPKNVQS